MSTLVSVVHIFTCVLLILVVLIQSGKGAEISASFGGSSQTVFGSSGGATFFVKFTSALAAIFFATSLFLTIYGGESRKSLFEGTFNSGLGTTAPQQQQPAAPGAPAANNNAAAPAAPAAQGAPAAAPAAPVVPAAKK
jgi:preprotein translocase subunit SecG